MHLKAPHASAPWDFPESVTGGKFKAYQHIRILNNSSTGTLIDRFVHEWVSELVLLLLKRRLERAKLGHDMVDLNGEVLLLLLVLALHLRGIRHDALDLRTLFGLLFAVLVVVCDGGGRGGRVVSGKEALHKGVGERDGEERNLSERGTEGKREEKERERERGKGGVEETRSGRREGRRGRKATLGKKQ